MRDHRISKDNRHQALLNFPSFEVLLFDFGTTTSDVHVPLSLCRRTKVYFDRTRFSRPGMLADDEDFTTYLNLWHTAHMSIPELDELISMLEGDPDLRETILNIRRDLITVSHNVAVVHSRLENLFQDTNDRLKRIERHLGIKA